MNLSGKFISIYMTTIHSAVVMFGRKKDNENDFYRCVICGDRATNGVSYITAPSVFSVTVSNVHKDPMFCLEHFIQELEKTAQKAREYQRANPPAGIK